MSHDAKSSGSPARKKTLLTAALCGGILLLAVLAVFVIRWTEPGARKSEATRRSAALVEIVEATRGTYRPVLEVLGTVEPARDILLSPRVGGEVLSIAPNFLPGGFVRQGEELVRIDPADFENAVVLREADLQEARATLALEEGRRSVAEQEYALLGEDLPEADRGLVLREPQLESARARVEASRAALEQARLDLARATVTAPFDGQVLRRNVNIGSQVEAGSVLARLVGTDEYWVQATVPVRHLRWVVFADDVRGEGSPVEVRHRGAWEAGEVRTGRVVRLIGTVDEETRLARVLVSVPDPLGREADVPPLLLGTVVQTRIEGRAIENVVRLDRDYLRENDTVWVFADGKLQIRSAQVIYRDGRYAYLTDGVEDAEDVVTTSLATVAEGLPLRLADEAEESAP